MRRNDRKLEWWERRHVTLLAEAVRRIQGEFVLSDGPRTMQVFDRSGTLLFTASFRQNAGADFVRAVSPARDVIARKDDLVSPRQALELLIDHHLRPAPAGVWS